MDRRSIQGLPEKGIGPRARTSLRVPDTDRVNHLGVMTTPTPDDLDVLLTDSAPAETTSTPGLRHDLAVMAVEARAASVFDWAPWARDTRLACPARTGACGDGAAFSSLPA